MCYVFIYVLYVFIIKSFEINSRVFCPSWGAFVLGAFVLGAFVRFPTCLSNYISNNK